jgi:hypothetical protein
MTWFYKDKPFTSDMIEGHQGFVYVITNTADNNKKYIGKKNFIRKITRQPLKGFKRKRKFFKESDWKEYYGSSDKVNQLLLEHGPEVFHREIIHLCKTKGEMSYVEAYYQMITHALISDEYYNGIIGCRINHRSVTMLDPKTLKTEL